MGTQKLNSRQSFGPVADVVWPWSKPVVARSARWRWWFLQPVLMALITALFVWRMQYVPAVLLGCLAAFILFSGFYWKRAYTCAVSFEKKFAQGFAGAVSMVVLGAFFYLLFVPVHLILHVTGKDSMRRRPFSEQNSYWLKRVRHDGPDKYHRQY